MKELWLFFSDAIFLVAMYIVECLNWVNGNGTSEQKGSFSRKSSVSVCSCLKMCACSNLTGSAEMYSSMPCLRARSVSPWILAMVELFPDAGVSGGVGLCNWPVARYNAITHKCDSASSSAANTTLSPSLTALKKNRPPSRSTARDPWSVRPVPSRSIRIPVLVVGVIYLLPSLNWLVFPKGWQKKKKYLETLKSHSLLLHHVRYGR